MLWKFGYWITYGKKVLNVDEVIKWMSGLAPTKFISGENYSKLNIQMGNLFLKENGEKRRKGEGEKKTEKYLVMQIIIRGCTELDLRRRARRRRRRLWLPSLGAWRFHRKRGEGSREEGVRGNRKERERPGLRVLLGMDASSEVYLRVAIETVVMPLQQQDQNRPI